MIKYRICLILHYCTIIISIYKAHIITASFFKADSSKHARFIEKGHICRKGPQILQKGHRAKAKGPHLSNLVPKCQTMETLNPVMHPS